MSLFVSEAPRLGNLASVGGITIPKYEEQNVYLSATSTSLVVYIIPPQADVSGSSRIPVTYVVTEVRVAFGTASSSGTLQIEHLTGTQASGGGTALLGSTISLSGTANTVIAAAPTSSTAATLGPGDRLGIVLAGTLTGLANCCVVISLVRVS